MTHSVYRNFPRVGFLIVLALTGSIALTGHAQEKGLLADERNTIEVFRMANRGVVHINARRIKESKFEKEIREEGKGTGFVIDKQGHILTAFHVIEGMNQIVAVFESGQSVSAKLIGTAPSLDVALLQVDIPGDQLFPLTLGESETLEVGQKVVAIGNPIGLHNTLTVGVVSALRRSLEGSPVELEDAMIQTDAAINPGNSGGPLLNSEGEVVGINDAIVAKAQNLGFALPIHYARRVLPDLVAMGHPYHPQLGFSGSAITPSIAKLFGLPLEEGFLVEQILPGSPAAMAGLRAGARIVMVADEPFVLGGDIIVAVDGNAVRSASQIARALLESQPGQRLRLSVYREGKRLEFSVLLEKMQMQF